jgi:hypothetical protein
VGRCPPPPPPDSGLAELLAAARAHLTEADVAEVRRFARFLELVATHQGRTHMFADPEWRRYLGLDPPLPPEEAPPDA